MRLLCIYCAHLIQFQANLLVDMVWSNRKKRQREAGARPNAGYTHPTFLLLSITISINYLCACVESCRALNQMNEHCVNQLELQQIYCSHNLQLSTYHFEILLILKCCQFQQALKTQQNCIWWLVGWLEQYLVFWKPLKLATRVWSKNCINSFIRSTKSTFCALQHKDPSEIKVKQATENDKVMN